MSNFNLADYIKPPEGAAKPAERRLQMIPTRKIFANDKNFYDTSKVDDLIDSILMQGLLDPLTVRPSGDGEGYIIISGHRRHRALMTILDDHLAEDTKPFETTPCFVRDPGDDLMEELMLIQANSATRVLTSAETSKQVDRVRDLLYGLKSQGYEFPGRMRDYVASACNISASKIARLDTIKTKLIPQIKQYYVDGRMPESVAYEIAKCSEDDQQLIAKVKGNGQDGLCAMRCGEAERILSDRDSLAARKCKYACGAPCGNMVKSLQKTTGNYMRSCEHTCCMECYDIATCDKYCKVAKDRHLQLREDKAEAEQRANDEAAHHCGGACEWRHVLGALQERGCRVARRAGRGCRHPRRDHGLSALPDGQPAPYGAAAAREQKGGRQVKIYIAGKITGDPYYKAKFARAAADIADAGHTPINPAMQPEGMSNADYMRISFAQLDSADAVAFLPDWEDSKGARIEHLLVEYTGKPTYDIKSARYYRWTLATTREGKIRGVVDGRWDFNGMTSDKVMDAMRLCTGAGFENCDKCPLHDVDNCDDVLMQAAFELLQHHQFLIDEQEAGHGK